MPSNQSSKESSPKFARVQVTKDGVQIGNYRYAKDAIIARLPFAEAQYRKSEGEVIILNVIPE